MKYSTLCFSRWHAAVLAMSFAAACAAQPANPDVGSPGPRVGSPSLITPSAATPAVSCPPIPQQLAAEQIQAGMQSARDHGFLWRIRKGDHSSYLYGTVHVARLANMFPGPSVVQAVRESDTVALELDMLDPDIQTRLREGMTQSKPMALPDALAQRLAKQVEFECLPANALASLRPEVQVTALSALTGRRDGIDPAYGIDNFLAGFARGGSKRVVSLETPELQLTLLKMPTPEATIEMVEAAVTELESGRTLQTLQRIFKVWVEGDDVDLARYDKWCECTPPESERLLMKRMLDDRNPGLADGIHALHEAGQRVFAAVGSLHMIGPLGLPALMAQRGYQVERVLMGR
jgi:uncharacterized protein